MKPEVKLAEVKLAKNPTSNTPFRPGVWLNKSEIEKVLEYLPADSWLRADLIAKFEIAQKDAERQTAAYCAGADVKVIDIPWPTEGKPWP